MKKNTVAVDKDFLQRVLNRVDFNTDIVKAHDKRLKRLEGKQISKLDMDILFKTLLNSQDHRARGQMFEDELSRLIRRYSIRKLNISYER